MGGSSAACAIFSAALIAALRCGRLELERDADSMLASGNDRGIFGDVVGFSVAGTLILSLSFMSGKDDGKLTSLASFAD